MAKWYYFDHKRSKALLGRANQSPIRLLDSETKIYLETEEYIVTPKVNGSHALLLCESHSGHFYLISKSYTRRIYHDIKFNGRKGVGFLLETKVISSHYQTSPVIVVYDICDNKRIEQTYLSKHTLIASLIEQINTTNIHLVPIATTHQVESLWQQWQRLPYGIGGLIFHPSQQSKLRILRVIKWEPLSSLSFNVLLGDVLESDEERCCFKAYLNDASKASKVPKQYYSGRTNYLLDQVVAVDHSTFALVSRRRQPEFTLNLTDSGVKIDYNHQQVNDHISLQIDLVDEGMKADNAWIEASLSDTASTIVAQSSTEFIVWVPKELLTWVRYGVVEVSFPTQISKSRIELIFKCVRYDKQRGSSIDAVNSIFKNHLHPTKLGDIKFKQNSIPQEMISAEVSVVVEPSPSKSIDDHSSKRSQIDIVSSYISRIPFEVKESILQYLRVKDLVTCRRVSHLWREEVDSMIDSLSLSREVQKAYFTNTNRGIGYDTRLQGYVVTGTSFVLPKQAVALYVRIGGQLQLPQIELSQSDQEQDYFEGDDGDEDDEGEDLIYLRFDSY